jgi:pyruvate/2-oxoglutarate dehydrogenase complex dihydrolipoamide dehydrogenase (E3) component
VRQQFIKDGIRLYENSNLKTITYKDKFTVKFNNKTITGSHLLVALGRTPNIEKLNLAAAEVEFSDKGIVINNSMRTTNKRIFAIGDVTTSYKFTHIANYQAGIVLRKMLFHLPAKTNYKTLPWVTFTTPEIANVGMHEVEAHERYKNIKILKSYFTDNDRAQTENDTAGLIKVVVTDKGRILGVSIVGHNAGEVIQPWILAMSQNLTIKSLAQMIVPYPTRGEINKQVAASFYTPILFSTRVKKIVRFLLWTFTK